MPSPTIAAVLAEFLDEQKQRLSPKTFAQYKDVVELLQHSLNGYAYVSLSERDANASTNGATPGASPSGSSASSSGLSTSCRTWASS